jgi:hypothetical protein
MLNSQVSMEVVRHQFDTPFIDNLKEIISKIKSADTPEQNALIVELESLVLNRTGLNLNIEIINDKSPNAGIVPDPIHINNVLMLPGQKLFYDESSTLGRLKKSENLIEGTIDFEKGRVTGVFSKIPLPTHLHKGLFTSKFSTGEIAAVLLHEMGHAFTFFSYVGITAKINASLQAISEGWRSETKEEKIKITRYLSKTYNVDEDILTEQSITGNETGMTAIMVGVGRQKVRSALGSEDYDESTAENMADQFAVRMGAGKELATGLDKIHHPLSTPEKWHPWLWFSVQVLAIIGYSRHGALLDNLAIMGIMSLMFPPLKTIYDKPSDRLERIKRECVSRLKAAKTRDQKKEIQHTLNVIDEILKKYHTINVDYVKTFFTYTLHRKQLNKKKQQQLLEKLGNNSLFIAANKLDMMNEA